MEGPLAATSGAAAAGALLPCKAVNADFRANRAAAEQMRGSGENLVGVDAVHGVLVDVEARVAAGQGGAPSGEVWTANLDAQQH